MTRRLIGTINKRVDIGVDESTDIIYIHASSNCITFTTEEMECLLSVLNIVHGVTLEEAVEWFHKHRIKMWTPAPPPAEFKL